MAAVGSLKRINQKDFKNKEVSTVISLKISRPKR
jgi:hypothetical protein